MKQAKRTIAILLSIILLLIAATGIPMTAMAAGSKTEYTYQLSVKTTNDADGWNNASFILSNSMDHSVQDRYWDIKSNIDDSDEEWSTTFSSKDFYDVARLYVDFGGGLGSRDWQGRVTITVNGNTLTSAIAKASSSTGSSSNSHHVYHNWIPYPQSSAVFQKDESGNKDYTLQIKQSKTNADGIAEGYVFAEMTDQYDVQWINWDAVTFSASNADTDSIAFFDASDTGRRLKAQSTSGTDHTSHMVMTYTPAQPDYDLPYSLEPYTQEFDVDFLFWHKATVEASAHGTVTVSNDKAYTGETVTLNITPDAGYALENLTVTDGDGNDVPVANNAFTMPNGDVTVRATFSPAPYTAKFIADGKIVAQIPYTVETTEIDEPEVPEKPGYIGTWRPHTLDIGGVTVEAVYEVEIHDFRVSDSMPATCTTEGYDTYTCTICGESYNKITTPVTDHRYNAVISQEATCTQKGLVTYTCQQCANTYTEETPVLSHAYRVTETTAATCTAEGHDTYTCTLCGDSYNKATTPAVGHTYKVTEKVAATCTAEGYDTYTCTLCGDSYNKTTTPAIGHTYKVTDTAAATCTAAGYDTYTCALCGDSYNKITTPVTDHQYNAVITQEASCTQKGLVTYTCKQCTSFYTEETPTLGHEWRADWSCGENDHWHDCTRCEAVNDQAAHTFGQKGDARFTCTVCGYVNEDRQAQAEADDTKIAKFVADGKTVEEVPFKIGTVSIENPPVPEKDGYTAAWPFYRLGTEDITIDAVYTPITYIATFVARGEIVGEVEYTVESTQIDEPEVPERIGYAGTWEEYTFDVGGITVNAVYTMTANPSVAIDDYCAERKVIYHKTLTYTATAAEVPDGAEVHWFLNGEDVGVLDELTVARATEDYTVQAKIINIEDGSVLAESEIAEVHVCNCFFIRALVFIWEKLCCLFCNLTFPVRFVLRLLFGCCIKA